MARTRQTGRSGAVRNQSPLVQACFRGDVEEVRRLLLEQDSSANDNNNAATNNAPKMTPLHWASMQGHVKVVQVLKEHCLGQASSLQQAATPMTESENESGVAKSKNSAWLAAVNAKDESERAPLQLARNKAMVRCLLQNGAQIEFGGGAALGMGCSGGDMELVSLVLEEAARQNVVPQLVTCNNNDPLRAACWNGHFEIAKVLLQHGADWTMQQTANRRSNYSSPPFQFSIDALPQASLKEKYSQMKTKEEAIQFVDFILEKEVLYNQLVQATKDDDLELAKKLLDKDSAFPNSLNRQNHCESPLGLAVTRNNLAFARTLLEQYGANVNVGGSFHYSPPLMDVTSAPKGRWDMFQLLMQAKGVNVNLSGLSDGYTPLHWACRNGQAEMIQSLLEHGADVHAKTDGSNGGCTPMHFACRWLEEEDDDRDRKATIFRLLLQHGSNTESRDFDDDRTPLQRLAGGPRSLRNQGQGEVEAVELLLAHGADVDAKEGKTEDDSDYDEEYNEPGSTALNLAIVRGRNYDIAKTLIQKGGANVHIRSGVLMSDGMTNLHSLCFRQPAKRKLDLIELMLDKSGTIGEDSTSLLEARYGFYEEGRTPLHIACEEGNFHVVKVLLAKGANLFLTTHNGSSCLDLARERGDGIPFTQCLDRTIQLAEACREQNSERIQSIVTTCQEQGGELFPQLKVPETGRHLLDYVCHLGLMEPTKRLVANGADIKSKRDVDGKAPIDIAKDAGHTDIAEWLQKHAKGEVSRLSIMTNEEATTHLFELIEKGSGQSNDASYAQLVKTCIVDGGVDVNCKDKYNFDKTPLHLAAAYGDLDVVRLLIELGANVNVRDALLSTPLHACAAYSSAAIMALLLANGADALAEDEEDNSPLHLASARGYKAMAKLLLGHGANVLSTNCMGKPPHAMVPWHLSREDRALWENTFHLVQAVKDVTNDFAIEDWRDKLVFGDVKIPQSSGTVTWTDSLAKSVNFVNSCQQGNLEATEHFVRLNIFDQTESADTSGESLLHFFSRAGNLKFSKYLVDQCGAEVNAQRDDGMTPLAVAARDGHCEIVEWLIRESVSVAWDLPDNWGNTALHHACRQGHLNIVKLFFVNAEDKAAGLLSKRNWLLQTPKDAALGYDRSEVATYLRAFGV